MFGSVSDIRKSTRYLSGEKRWNFHRGAVDGTLIKSHKRSFNATGSNQSHVGNVVCV